MNMLRPSRFVCLLQLALLAAGGVVSGSSQNVTSRVPLTSAMVAAALSRQGLDVTADQLELPAHLTASGTPDVQVTQAELVAPQRLRVHLTCAQLGQCQPFLVTIQLPNTSSGLLSLSTLKQSSLPPSLGAASSGEHLLAGQHVTLLMEDARMRIVLPVIAIDSGVRGTEVRVSSLDRKRSYLAVVEDAGTVRGVLP